MRSALPSDVFCEGKARQPLAFSCLFSYRLSLSAKSGKKRPKRRFAFAGLCLPDSELYLATRGGTGAYGRGFGGNINVVHLRSPR